MSQNPWACNKFAMAPQGTGAGILGEKRAQGLTYLERPQAALHPMPTWPKEDNNPAWGRWTMPQYCVLSGERAQFAVKVPVRRRAPKPRRDRERRKKKLKKKKLLVLSL